MRDTDDNLTEKQDGYCGRVIDACNDTKYRTISPGLTGLCPDCVSNFGYEDEEDDNGDTIRTAEDVFAQDLENGDVCDEGGFSWQDCDVCGSALGGDRYAAHGFDANGDVLHYDICADCLCYLANGDVPEDANL